MTTLPELITLGNSWGERILWAIKVQTGIVGLGFTGLMYITYNNHESEMRKLDTMTIHQEQTTTVERQKTREDVIGDISKGVANARLVDRKKEE